MEFPKWKKMREFWFQVIQQQIKYSYINDGKRNKSIVDKTLTDTDVNTWTEGLGLQRESGAIANCVLHTSKLDAQYKWNMYGVLK